LVVVGLLHLAAKVANFGKKTLNNIGNYGIIYQRTYHDQEELEMINYVSKKNEIKFSPFQVIVAL
jgi:hypothetical protein